VGDTDSTDQLVSDEEITYSVTTTGTTLLAAGGVAAAIAAKFARKADRSVGDLSISYSQRYDHYLALSKDLIASANDPMAGTLTPRPYSGGISVSDKDTRERDNDRVQPNFRRGLHDNPRPAVNEDRDDDYL
jgi:hypothetical protein